MDAARSGRLRVIAGPMFAGKTEELLRRVHRARLAGRTVEVVGHRLDDRGGPDRLSTHIGRTVPARMLREAGQVAELLQGALPDLLAIDEVQFFGEAIRGPIDAALAAGVDVEAAGLCVTWDGEPFAPLPALMAQAEEVAKLTAVCAVCGADAAFHVRRTERGGSPLVASAEVVGGAESYQARCRSHRAPGPGPVR